jgi:hypothetical protein
MAKARYFAGCSSTARLTRSQYTRGLGQIRHGLRGRCCRGCRRSQLTMRWRQHAQPVHGHGPGDQAQPRDPGAFSPPRGRGPSRQGRGHRRHAEAPHRETRGGSRR